MKANYQIEKNNSQPMDRQQRRDMHKRLMPTIKRVVELENQIKSGVNKEAAENEMGDIFEHLTMIEMFAIEDYIYKHKLLDNKK